MGLRAWEDFVSSLSQVASVTGSEKIVASVAGVSKYITLDLMKGFVLDSLPTITVGPTGSSANFICDGVSDQEEFQSANNAVASTGGKVEVLPGSYSFTNGVVVDIGVSFFGANRESFITLANGANCGVFKTNVNGIGNSIIKGFTIDGNASHQTSAGGSTWGDALVYLTGRDTLFKSVLFTDNSVINSYKHAVFFTGGNTADRHQKVIFNNYIENHGPSAVGYGIYVDYCRNTLVLGNTIKTSNGNDAIEMGNQGEIFTVGNYIYDGQLQFPFASNSIIANNMLRANTIQNDNNTADNMLIIGNQVLGATPSSGFAGISVSGSNSIIIGNRVKVTTESGINVYSGDGHIVTGNQLDGTNKTTGGSNGIYAENSSYVTISDNKISRFAKAIAVTHDDLQINSNTAIDCVTGLEMSDSTSSGHVMERVSVNLNNFHDTTTAIEANNQSAALGGVNNEGVNPARNFSMGNVSGATTFSRTEGQTLLFTVTGDITATVEDGLIVGDTLIRVFIMGGAGAYTYTESANEKLNGGSFTPSSTVGDRSVLTQVWDGVFWVEQSREVGLS